MKLSHPGALLSLSDSNKVEVSSSLESSPSIWRNSSAAIESFLLLSSYKGPTSLSDVRKVAIFIIVRETVSWALGIVN